MSVHHALSIIILVGLTQDSSALFNLTATCSDPIRMLYHLRLIILTHDRYGPSTVEFGYLTSLGYALSLYLFLCFIVFIFILIVILEEVLLHHFDLLLDTPWIDKYFVLL